MSAPRPPPHPTLDDGLADDSSKPDAPDVSDASPVVTTTPPARARVKPGSWEWIPVALWPLLAILAYAPPKALAGPLLPCLAFGLLPGCLWRLAGRRSGGMHRIGLALALMAYLGRKQDFSGVDFGRIAGNWPWVLAGLALVATQPFLGAWRWAVLLRAGGWPMAYAPCLRLGLTGTFFNLAIPGSTGGDLLRVGYLAESRKGDDGRWTGALASVALDRLLGTPALLLLVTAAYAFNADWVAGRPFLARLFPLVLLAAAVSLLMTAALLWWSKPLHAKVSSWAARGGEGGGRKRRGAALAGRLTGILAVYGGAWRAVGAGLLIGLASHGLTALATVCFGRAVGVAGIPARAYFLLTPAGMAGNAVPATPGGIGQGEWAFAELFELAAPGMGNGPSGMLVMICVRLGLLLVGLAGGVIYLSGKHRPPASPKAAETANEVNAVGN